MTHRLLAAILSVPLLTSSFPARLCAQDAQQPPADDKALKQEMDGLSKRYALTDEQKTKIAALIKARDADLQKWQEADGAAVKTAREQVAKLNDEIKAKEAARANVLAIHAKAIDAVITADQRLAAIVSELLNKGPGAYAAQLPDDKKTQVTEVVKTVAKTISTISETDAKKRHDAEQAAIGEMNAALEKVVPADVRATALAVTLAENALKGVGKVTLTDEQNAKVKAMAAAMVAERQAMEAAQAAAQNQANELRDKLRAKQQDKLRDAIAKDILTDDQRAGLKGGKPKAKEEKPRQSDGSDKKAEAKEKTDGEAKAE